jgi:phosphatidylinositol glycan class V
MSSPHRAQAQARPYGTLLASFAAWKLFLFAIALGSTLVGDAYDTSAGLVVVQGPGAAGSGDDGGAHLATPVTDFGRRLVARFASWDAIYFVSIARRGYRFEQDWAFGAGLPLAVRGLLRGEHASGVDPKVVVWSALICDQLDPSAPSVASSYYLSPSGVYCR